MIQFFCIRTFPETTRLLIQKLNHFCTLWFINDRSWLQLKLGQYQRGSTANTLGVWVLNQAGSAWMTGLSPSICAYCREHLYSFPLQAPTPRRYCCCEHTKLCPAVFQGSPCEHKFRFGFLKLKTQSLQSLPSTWYNTLVPIFYLGFVYPYSVMHHETVPCYDLVGCICWSSWITWNFLLPEKYRSQMSNLGQSANPRGTISGNCLHHVRTKILWKVESPQLRI